MKKQLLVASTVAAMIASSAHAVESATGVYIAPSLSYQMFDDNTGDDSVSVNLDFTNELGFGFAFGYQFDSPFAVEIAYHQTGTEHDDRSGSFRGNDADAKYLHLDALYHFEDEDSAWAPYIVAGVGKQDYEAELTTATSKIDFEFDETTYNLGLGLKYKVNSNFHIRGDIRATLGDAEGSTGGLANLGFMYIFGEAKTKKAEEPQEPVVTDVDNDGIPDAQDQCPGSKVGVPVGANGCELDSDADGIVDSLDKCSTTEAGIEVDETGCAKVGDSDNDGVPNELDECQGTTAGAKVIANGCEIDSDSDGVVDSKDMCPNSNPEFDTDEKGCYAKIEKDISFRLNVNFASGSSRLTAESNDSIQELADILKANPEVKASVVGYTDSTGSAAGNKRVSQKRADSVKAKLIENGVEASRITAKGMGEANPIADNNTAEGRAENRRVIAEITK